MHFVVTTDSSERSLQALPHAARLAEVVGAELVVLRVLDPLLDAGTSRAERLAEAAREVAAEWTSELEQITADLGVPTRALVEIKERGEDTAETVLRVAAQSTASLICMATRGSGLFRRAVLGSVATAVIGKSTVPILLTGERVLPPRQDRPYRILATTDGSPAALTVLPSLGRILEGAASEAVRLTLLRVNEKAGADPLHEPAYDVCQRELAAFAEGAPRRFDTEHVVRNIVPLGGVDSAIVSAAAESHADTIWMATHGHSFRRHALLGSVALGTLSQSVVPVVLTRAQL